MRATTLLAVLPQRLTSSGELGRDMEYRYSGVCCTSSLQSLANKGEAYRPAQRTGSHVGGKRDVAKEKATTLSLWYLVHCPKTMAFLFLLLVGDRSEEEQVTKSITIG